MGDHRRDSADSRSHTGEPGGGTIKESTVVGRAFVVVWPLAHGRNLPIPATFKGGPQPQAAAGRADNGSGAVAVTPEPVGSAAVVLAGTLVLVRLRLRRRDRSARGAGRSSRTPRWNGDGSHRG
jgi:signal peptidase I